MVLDDCFDEERGQVQVDLATLVGMLKEECLICVVVTVPIVAVGSARCPGCQPGSRIFSFSFSFSFSSFCRHRILFEIWWVLVSGVCGVALAQTSSLPGKHVQDDREDCNREAELKGAVEARGAGAVGWQTVAGGLQNDAHQ